jgi:monoamine oxidase
VERANTVIDL